MFSDFYHSFYYSILFIGALTGLLLVNRVNTPFKWLSILLMVTLMSELLAKYLSSYLKISSNPVYHFFTVIEYLLYVIVYRYFFAAKLWSKILTISAWIFFTAEIINVIFFQPMQTTNTNTMILESLLLIFLSLSLFLKLRASIEYENILLEGVFWFNASVLFYYSFNILIWGFHSIRVYELKNPPDIIYSLILLLSGLLYLFYSASIILNYLNVRKLKSSS